jgi:hypothetical protein
MWSHDLLDSRVESILRSSVVVAWFSRGFRVVAQASDAAGQNYQGASAVVGERNRVPRMD